MDQAILKLYCCFFYDVAVFLCNVILDSELKQD